MRKENLLNENNWMSSVQRVQSVNNRNWGGGKEKKKKPNLQIN